MERRIFWYEALLLWGIGTACAGLELWLVHFPPEFLTPQLYIRFQTQSSIVVSTALVAQFGVQLAVATCVGLWAAHQVDLGAPVLEAWLQNKQPLPSLRRFLVPVIGVAILLSICSDLTDLSVFHPNRKQRTAELTAFFQTQEGLKLQQQLDKLEPPPRRMSTFSQALFYIQNAVNGGIYDQLFMVSVFALVLLQVTRTSRSGPGTRVLWVAILIVTIIRAISLLVWQSNPSEIDQIIQAIFPTHRDPFSLIAARSLIRMVPSSLALGWLYVRHGIEAAIVTSFIAALFGHLLFIYVFLRFI